MMGTKVAMVVVTLFWSITTGSAGPVNTNGVIGQGECVSKAKVREKEKLLLWGHLLQPINNRLEVFC